VSPGRWIVSLPCALLGAGAQTVVGSLWEVLDDVSVMFTQTFYERLRTGLPPDEALREALQMCRRRSTGEQRPLWDWAGFVLTGASTPVRWRCA
jgi:CHAT domain-containing protein